MLCQASGSKYCPPPRFCHIWNHLDFVWHCYISHCVVLDKVLSLSMPHLSSSQWQNNNSLVVLEELIEIILVTLLAQCLEYGVKKCLFAKSINKIILAHIKSIPFNDKPPDEIAWQKHEKHIQIQSWKEGNWHSKTLKE